MAQSTFKVGTPKVLTAAEAESACAEKDARNLQWHIPAETGSVLILTGNTVEISWSRAENGKVIANGSFLCAEAQKADGTNINVAYGFFKSKVLVSDEETRTFKACFERDTPNLSIFKSLEKGKKVKVVRGDFVFPGRSSARQIDTVQWVNDEKKEENEG